MSYNIKFGVKVDSTDIMAVVGRPRFPRPDKHIVDLINECTGMKFEKGNWYKVNLVMPSIEYGLHRLKSNACAYQEYNFRNGATRVDAVGAAKNILCAIRSRVCKFEADGIPQEHLYISW